MKPTIRLPRQIATAPQILRGVVDTDPQGEVCEASADCTDADQGVPGSAADGPRPWYALPPRTAPLSSEAAEMGLVAEEIAGLLLQRVPAREPEHGWCWRCHVHPIRSRHAVLCETCLAAVHAQPAVGHA